jgi:hypothetical protein
VNLFHAQRRFTLACMAGGQGVQQNAVMACVPWSTNHDAYLKLGCFTSGSSARFQNEAVTGF